MIQINGSFKSCYYLTEDCRIYNADKDIYISADKRNNFHLKTKDNNTRKISKKILYQQVYNKPYCIDKIENIENEIWKEIENTNGKYYISSKGRLKSYAREEAVLLKATLTKNGYLRAEIKQEDIRANKLIHRLVAAAFLPKPNNIEMQLHHKDFNKLNNSADNLEWLTPAQHRQKHAEQRTKSAFTQTINK